MGKFLEIIKKGRRTRLNITVVMGSIVGFVVCYEVHSFLRDRESLVTQPRILIAERDLLRGHVISFTDFRFEISMDRQKVIGQKMVTDQELHLLDRMVLVNDLSKGEVLSWRMLKSVPGNKRLGTRIPKGLRAYSLRPTNSLQVFPKDRIDVLLKPHNPGEPPLTLVDGALVLQIVKTRGHTDIVVAVAQYEIQLMEKALQRGKLSIALRNPDEAISDRFRKRNDKMFQKRRKKPIIEVWSEGD